MAECDVKDERLNGCGSKDLELARKLINSKGIINSQAHIRTISTCLLASSKKIALNDVNVNVPACLLDQECFVPVRAFLLAQCCHIRLRSETSPECTVAYSIRYV